MKHTKVYVTPWELLYNEGNYHSLSINLIKVRDANTPYKQFLKHEEISIDSSLKLSCSNQLHVSKTFSTLPLVL